MFILSLIKPTCLWGENAPGLYTPVGQEVLHKLKEIGMTFNYTFSVGKINTGLHGIPQLRVRTFYFFGKVGWCLHSCK